MKQIKTSPCRSGEKCDYCTRPATLTLSNGSVAKKTCGSPDHSEKITSDFSPGPIVQIVGEAPDD